MQTLEVHPFPPVWDTHSRILILGSFPSVRSREIGFYYGHPQNRFWPLLARLYRENIPVSVEERRHFVLRHRIALWDVIESCLITGSSDSSIQNAKPNNITGLIQTTRICNIYCNGHQAWKLYQKYCARSCGIDGILLPSTSPANAAWSTERLTTEWQKILETDCGKAE